MRDEGAVGLVRDGLREHLRGRTLADDADGEVVRRRGVERAEVREAHAGGEEQRDQGVRGEVPEGRAEAVGTEDAVARGAARWLRGGVGRRGVRRGCVRRGHVGGRGVDRAGRRKVVLCNFRHVGQRYTATAAR
ncbi:hypothetical protein GCM10009769_01130 [Curtobacterium luteum]|uniref:Uncharacterized protein n=1 Tax=Curtobacterium luteum TaxID=33881 RepID=A0A8H9G8K8_9MICO|nr:hypothetical protein GCM10009769_01130 [Curtobacterium luteum]